MHAEETADPSTPLRSGRDDTFYGPLSRLRTLDFPDVLGLKTHADEASGEVMEAGNLCDDAKREGWGD